MSELLTAVLSWRSLVLVLLVFGAAPGAVLRILVLAYPRRDVRRTELRRELAEHAVWERPIFVAEQVEVALFEGLLPRLALASRRAAHVSRVGFGAASLWMSGVERRYVQQRGWVARYQLVGALVVAATTWNVYLMCTIADRLEGGIWAGVAGLVLLIVALPTERRDFSLYRRGFHPSARQPVRVFWVRTVRCVVASLAIAAAYRLPELVSLISKLDASVPAGQPSTSASFSDVVEVCREYWDYLAAGESFWPILATSVAINMLPSAARLTLHYANHRAPRPVQVHII